MNSAIFAFTMFLRFQIVGGALALTIGPACFAVIGNGGLGVF
ncbi:MAG: hypothetical protein ABI369_01620 [Acetobacteraceae bacterium]